MNYEQINSRYAVRIQIETNIQDLARTDPHCFVYQKEENTGIVITSNMPPNLIQEIVNSGKKNLNEIYKRTYAKEYLNQHRNYIFTNVRNYLLHVLGITLNDEDSLKDMIIVIWPNEYKNLPRPQNVWSPLPPVEGAQPTLTQTD